MVWDPVEAKTVLDRYEQLWSGKLTEPKADLFAEKLRNFSPDTVIAVLENLATWRETSQRPSIGNIISACHEHERKDRPTDRQPGEEEQGESISLREYVARIRSGEHIPQLPPWDGGGPTPDAEVERGLRYLDGIMNKGLASE